MMKFKYYQDLGHGWVAVKRELLKTFGIENEISSYSYQKGGTVYLEEDCDASLFLNILENKKIDFELVRVYQRYTPIRRYNSYRVGA